MIILDSSHFKGNTLFLQFHFPSKRFNLTHPVSGKLIFTPHYEEGGFDAGGVPIMSSVVLVILILKFHETKLKS